MLSIKYLLRLWWAYQPSLFTHKWWSGSKYCLGGINKKWKLANVLLENATHLLDTETIHTKIFSIMFNFNFCLSFSLFSVFILLRKIEWNPKPHKSFHFTQSSELNFFKLDLFLPLTRSWKCSWLCIMRTWKAKKEQHIDSALKSDF